MATNRSWRAVGTIMMADIIMSLDNVVAIAAVAHGSFILIVVGLTLSVPIVIAGSTLIVEAIRRFPAVVWAGSGFLGWIAGETFGVDSAVHPLVSSLASLPVIAAIGCVLVLILGWGIRAARKRQPYTPRRAERAGTGPRAHVTERSRS